MQKIRGRSRKIPWLHAQNKSNFQYKKENVNSGIKNSGRSRKFLSAYAQQFLQAQVIRKFKSEIQQLQLLFFEQTKDDPMFHK